MENKTNFGFTNISEEDLKENKLLTLENNYYPFNSLKHMNKLMDFINKHCDERCIVSFCFNYLYVCSNNREEIMTYDRLKDTLKIYHKGLPFLHDYTYVYNFVNTEDSNKCRQTGVPFIF